MLLMGRRGRALAPAWRSVACGWPGSCILLFGSR